MRNKNAKVSDPNSFITNPGSDEHILYSSELLPTGEIKLTPSGKESISEKINAQAKFTDINYIMTRLMQGDTSVVRDDAIYGDFTRTPKSLADALQTIMKGESEFNKLPLDVRNSFNNSYLAWMASAGSNDWFSKMGLNVPGTRSDEVSADLGKVSEVVNNES